MSFISLAFRREKSAWNRFVSGTVWGPWSRNWCELLRVLDVRTHLREISEIWKRANGFSLSLRPNLLRPRFGPSSLHKSGHWQAWESIPCTCSFQARFNSSLASTSKWLRSKQSSTRHCFSRFIETEACLGLLSTGQHLDLALDMFGGQTTASKRSTARTSAWLKTGKAFQAFKRCRRLPPSRLLLKMAQL